MMIRRCGTVGANSGPAGKWGRTGLCPITGDGGAIIGGGAWTGWDGRGTVGGMGCGGAGTRDGPRIGSGVGRGERVGGGSTIALGSAGTADPDDGGVGAIVTGADIGVGTGTIGAVMAEAGAIGTGGVTGNGATGAMGAAVGDDVISFGVGVGDGSIGSGVGIGSTGIGTAGMAAGADARIGTGTAIGVEGAGAMGAGKGIGNGGSCIIAVGDGGATGKGESIEAACTSATGAAGKNGISGVMSVFSSIKGVRQGSLGAECPPLGNTLTSGTASACISSSSCTRKPCLSVICVSSNLI